MHTPPRILVVDDNEVNRDILVTRLETYGYEMLQAADGEEAIAAAKKYLPDLILLDVMMPKIDGIEVTRRLKADKEIPFMPIILVTAKSDSKDVVEGLPCQGNPRRINIAHRTQQLRRCRVDGAEEISLERLGEFIVARR